MSRTKKDLLAETFDAVKADREGIDASRAARARLARVCCEARDAGVSLATLAHAYVRAQGKQPTPCERKRAASTLRKLTYRVGTRAARNAARGLPDGASGVSSSKAATPPAAPMESDMAKQKLPDDGLQLVKKTVYEYRTTQSDAEPEAVEEDEVEADEEEDESETEESDEDDESDEPDDSEPKPRRRR